MLRPLGRPRNTVVLVASLGAASFLQWSGASAVLPLLPLYLARRGTPDAVIGVVVAAFFVGGFVAQYAGGRLADRVGHRPVLVLGLVGYALASAGFVIDLGGAGYAVLRAFQGAAAGIAMVASLALVARQVPRAVRGRAFAVVYGAELTGMALGPLLGTVVGLDGMSTLFLVASGGALLACVPVLALRPVAVGRGETASAGPTGDGARLIWRGPRGRALVGVLVTAGFGGLMSGVYEACWSLLLDARGAATWQLAASWTLFAIPFVVVSPVAGWLADHRDRRVLVLAASASSVVFCVAYGFITSPAWLVGLGAFEAVGVAVAMPAAQSMLADAVPAGASGRAQGLFASVNTAAVALAALSAGGLFGVAPGLPFGLAGMLGALLVAALPVVWRGVPGRVTGGRDQAEVHDQRDVHDQGGLHDHAGVG
jgi:DHA1 family multidrug resistance protein-like MFS transporter